MYYYITHRTYPQMECVGNSHNISTLYSRLQGHELRQGIHLSYLINIFVKNNVSFITK
jgi:hypothetical protein